MMGMMGCGGTMLLSVLLWVAVIAAVVYLMVRLTRDGHRDDGRDRAWQLARERFARGEINAEELDDLERRLRP
ncbi:hypothetical protein [Deinococcus sp. YIM 77859]|uniref:hypothetical protein n=1 Tax=Deinococcus sp. YIM 77859 TaxID=1540221 RepID=UPI0005502BB7|nr:hypothetical protein [Deinococcus sp. YIM 77859]